MATGSPTSSPGSGSATPKSTSSSPTPAASPKTGPTASSPQHSPTRSIRARTTETAFTPTGAGTPSRIAANRNIRPLQGGELRQDRYSDPAERDPEHRRE